MKILLLTCATGGGHMRAAHAIEQYIRENTAFSVVTVDALKAVGRFLDKTICDSYLFMAKKAPSLFGKIYKSTNKQNRFSKLVPKISGAFSRMLLPSIRDNDPDVIISTHAFAGEMVSRLKEEGLVTAPLICIVTDYGIHQSYLADRIDAYVASNDDMVAELESFGVPKEKIFPFGIPVHEVFFNRTKDRETLLQELELDPALPTVLFMAGSFGVTNIISLYRELASTETKMQIIIITGRNQKLYDAFEKELADGGPVPTRLVFFTNEVEKYMQASDLLVTKPGGLTVSEALACSLPMAVFDAIPGQEEDNAEFLASHGMCVRLKDDSKFAEEISSLLREEERLEAMRKNCEGFDKSQSIPNLMGLIHDLTAQKEKAE